MSLLGHTPQGEASRQAQELEERIAQEAAGLRQAGQQQRKAAAVEMGALSGQLTEAAGSAAGGEPGRRRKGAALGSSCRLWASAWHCCSRSSCSSEWVPGGTCAAACGEGRPGVYNCGSSVMHHAATTGFTSYFAAAITSWRCLYK
jgi:hypothetical protein